MPSQRKHDPRRFQRKNRAFDPMRLAAAAVDITGAARGVLWAIAFHARRDGTWSFPSQARIAVESGVSERHVRRCLIDLEEAGYIQRMGKRRSRRGKPVIVWKVVLSILKGDTMAVRTAIQQITNTKQRLGKALRWRGTRLRASSAPGKDLFEGCRYQPGEPLPSVPGTW